MDDHRPLLVESPAAALEIDKDQAPSFRKKTPSFEARQSQAGLIGDDWNPPNSADFGAAVRAGLRGNSSQ